MSEYGLKPKGDYDKLFNEQGRAEICGPNMDSSRKAIMTCPALTRSLSKRLQVSEYGLKPKGDYDIGIFIFI